MRRTEQVLVNLLKENRLTIAFAESMTCGLTTHKLGTVNGTSDVLMGSIICYNENVKTSLLGVSKQLIRKNTAESQIVTDALAMNLKKIIHADVYAAITGLAAPGGSESKTKPVGTVFYSVFFKGKTYTRKKFFKGSPLDIKKKACEEFYKFITAEIKRAIKNNYQ